MGLSSDWAIEEHNHRLETDEEYAAAYAASEAFENWRAEEHMRREAEEEIYENFFDDYRISLDGYEETDEPPVVLFDEDLPF